MSEKRFTFEYDDGQWGVPLFYDDGKKLCFDDVVDLLNEQQATIRRLQDLCGESDGENAKLRIENKRLEKEVNLLKPTNIEQYEQIQKLQEENEQLEKLYGKNFAKRRLLEQDNLVLRNENEKLRKELGDCEKFRYTVFKRLNEHL